MKIGIIVQARMNSTRVPRKVSLLFGGKPLLWHVVSQLQNVRRADILILATGPRKANQWIINFAKKNNILWFSHKEESDVLTRFYLAAKKFQLDQIIRVCADNIFVDPDEIDHLIKNHLKLRSDYSRNTLTYHPDLGAEIISFKTLEKAFLEACTDYEKEHVTAFVYKSNPRLFKITEVNPKNSLPEKIRSLHLCIDTPKDVDFLTKTVKLLFDGRHPVPTRKIIDHLAALDKTYA